METFLRFFYFIFFLSPKFTFLKRNI
jgi:hypothetical protein